MTLPGDTISPTLAVSADLSQDHLAARSGRRAAVLRRQPVAVAVCIAHADQRTDSLRVSGLQQYQLLRSHPACRRERGGQHAPSPSPWISRIPGIFAFDGEEPRTAIAYHTSSYRHRHHHRGRQHRGGRHRHHHHRRPVVHLHGASRRHAHLGAGCLRGLDQRESRGRSGGGGRSRRSTGFNCAPRFRDRKATESPFGATTDMGDNANVFLILTNLSTTLCCANRAGSPVTQANPAVPGETILVYATGLGTVEPAEATAGREYRRQVRGSGAERSAMPLSRRWPADRPPT